MGIQTQAQAQVMLDKYYEAQLALADGQSFTFATETGTRSMTMVDLPSVERMIRLLERRVSAPSGQVHNVGLANFNHTK